MSSFHSDAPLEVVDNGSRFYDVKPAGDGRWATLAGLGVLWTDDRNGLQLGFTDGADHDAANSLRLLLVQYATLGWSASDAFDAVVADNGSPAVREGALSL